MHLNKHAIVQAKETVQKHLKFERGLCIFPTLGRSRTYTKAIGGKGKGKGKEEQCCDIWNKKDIKGVNYWAQH